MKIAVLMTCHNRREKTLACLSSLAAQAPLPDAELTVWLLDDGSTDGTSESVRRQFPAVRLIAGSGNLFWCGGMRAAWQAAAQEKPDVFLWLNDDVTLDPSALATLGASARRRPAAIIVGSCRAPDTGQLSYGGRRRIGAHPGKLTEQMPGADLIECDTFEGNIVWVPYAVYAQVGVLAPFLHSMGDIDYGYRAQKAGFPCYVAPGYLGSCARNPRSQTWEDAALGRGSRWKKITGIKGLPARDWWQFCRRHGGARAPLYFVSPYCRVLLGR